VAELFTAYVAILRAAGKRSARIVERSLVAAAESIGSGRPAAEVAPGDVMPHLAAIHDRGAKVRAAMVRTYRAAFAYGLKSEHDYTRRDAGARWGLTNNPVIAVPVAEGISNACDRFLSPSEVRTFWTWLEAFDVDSKFAPALRIMLATGQRFEEILRITAATYAPSRALLYWPTTKNGLPHSIPVPHQRPPSSMGCTPTRMACSSLAPPTPCGRHRRMACDSSFNASSRSTRKSHISCRAIAVEPGTRLPAMPDYPRK
jgi:integrase